MTATRAQGGPSGVYALEDEFGCVLSYSFRPKTGIYAAGYYCELEDGGQGVEVESGPYTVEGDRIMFKPDESTCETADLSAYSLKFVIYDNGDLFLAGAGSADEFVRVETTDSAGGMGGRSLLGCWEGEDFVQQ